MNSFHVTHWVKWRGPTHTHKKSSPLSPSAPNASLPWHTGQNPSHLSFGAMCPVMTQKPYAGTQERQQTPWPLSVSCHTAAALHAPDVNTLTAADMSSGGHRSSSKGHKQKLFLIQKQHCPEAQLKMCTVLGAPSVWKTVEFRIGPLVHLWTWETTMLYGVHFRTSSDLRHKMKRRRASDQKASVTGQNGIVTQTERLQVSGKTTSGVRSRTIRHQPKRTQIKRHQPKSHRAKRTQIKRHQTKGHRAKRTQVECDVSRCAAPPRFRISKVVSNGWGWQKEVSMFSSVYNLISIAFN